MKARLEAKPQRGPGSRQPVLKLPSEVNGRRIRVHPLVHLMKLEAEAKGEEANKSDVARALGIAPQSLYKWERACKADRNFPLPVLRASQLASYFKVPPSVFRPDFPWGNA